MKPDEEKLLLAIAEKCASPLDGQKIALDAPTPIDVIRDSGIHHKRATYILAKFARRGWYDWGVRIDLGWLTDEGRKQASLVHQQEKP